MNTNKRAVLYARVSSDDRANEGQELAALHFEEVE
jgi:predicted site-specific integrase-resolvase